VRLPLIAHRLIVVCIAYTGCMRLFHVTYWSDPYWVKGYLGLPEGCCLSPAQVSRALAAAQGIDHVRPVNPLAMDDTPPPELAQGGDQISAALCCSVNDSDDGGQPMTDATGRWPALVYCRGGIGRVGMVKKDWLHVFCAQGFVVFAPAYRGNEGGEGRDEFGGADCEDARAAVRLLRRLAFVRPDRVSLLGFSRGAVNAFRTAILEPGVHRLIQWGGVSDLSATYAERIDLRRMLRRVLHGTPTKAPAAYEIRSAVAHAAAIPCPTLIVHGTRDVQVNLSHAEKLYDALCVAARPVDRHIYEGYGHHLPEPVFTAAVERFSEWLTET